MSDLIYSTFQAISKRTRDRKIILWGTGDIAHKTMRKLNTSPTVAVDNDTNVWGISFAGLSIHPPSKLADGSLLKPYVIICSTSYADISRQLDDIGFAPEIDYAVSPILNDLRILNEIEEYKTDLIFTSGAPPRDDPAIGGGIYLLEVDGNEWEHRKLFSGNSHGITRYEDGYVAVDDDQGFINFDEKFQLIQNVEIEHGLRPHGIAYSEATESFYVASTYTDSIIQFDRNFRQIGKIQVSNKIEREGKPMHHINDLCVIGSSLMSLDGGVLEFDLTDGSKCGPVITDLWMPHSVLFIDGGLTVLDSLRGQLRRNNAQSVGTFPGFTRGLGYDGNMFFVGQSRNRNYSKYMGLSQNISIDTSIIIFDEATKVSRSISLPSKISEIHSIVNV